MAYIEPALFSEYYECILHRNMNAFHFVEPSILSELQ